MSAMIKASLIVWGLVLILALSLILVLFVVLHEYATLLAVIVGSMIAIIFILAIATWINEKFIIRHQRYQYNNEQLISLPRGRPKQDDVTINFDNYLTTTKKSSIIREW